MHFYLLWRLNHLNCLSFLASSALTSAFAAWLPDRLCVRIGAHAQARYLCFVQFLIVEADDTTNSYDLEHNLTHLTVLIKKMRTISSSFLNITSLKRPGFNPTLWRHALLHSSVGQRREEAAAESTETIILVEQYNAITLIGLNRPSKRNALNSELIAALRRELKRFEADELSSIAVLYGAGGNFCAGLDLDEISSDIPRIPLIDEYCCKPVIASVNGYAVGEGFDLAMACDARVMDDHAVFGSFNRRFGVPMSESALKRLSASAGFAFTMDIVLTGRPIKAEEALQRGLVQQVVVCGASKGNSLTLAQQITKYPQEALKADRAALFQTLRLPENLTKDIESDRKMNLTSALQIMQSKSKSFSEGVGKHGSFKNLTVQTGWPEWMKS